MKTLLLMRHAKSSWDNPFGLDHDRDLAPRGRTDAPKIGRWLCDHHLEPDAVLLSSATRVYQTWQLVKRELGSTAPVTTHKALYGTSPGHLLQTITQTPPNTGILLVINHEPTLSGLTQTLARPPVASDCARAFAKFPTAALAVLRFDAADWQSLKPQNARFINFVTPKDPSLT